MSSKSIISSLTTADYERAAVFLESRTHVYTSEFWLDRFKYWWDNNPAMNENIERGWIILGEGGQIVGFLGNIPVKYYINGKDEIVCCLTSWYVKETYRHKSLGLLAPFLKQREPILLLATTPSDKVSIMLLRLGFHDLESKWLTRDALYPVDLSESLDLFARRIALNKNIFFLFKCAGTFVLPVLKIFQIISKSRMSIADKNYTFREIDTFDSSYALLWDEFKKKYDMLAVRNVETLNWFFFGSKLLASGRKVIEIRCDNNLAGYAAVKEAAYSVLEKTYYYLEVVDMVVLDGKPAGYHTALKGLHWLAMKSGKKITFIKVNSFDDSVDNNLYKYGFFKQKGKSRFLYKTIGGINPTAISNFYATAIDGDRCFFP